MINQHLDGIVDSTVVHRIMKFERPNHDHTESLKRKCVEDWFLNEERLREVPKGYFQKKAKLRANIGKARSLILSWTRNYDKYLKMSELRFPNGETFISKQGRVSFHQKLLDKEIFGLTTYENADAAIDQIMSHASLRRCAKAHLSKRSKDENKSAFMYANGALDRKTSVGDYILRNRIRNELLNYVHGSRQSSVYKNSDERRLINVEAFQNVVRQLKVGSAIRMIHAEVGNELDYGQDRHRSMIESDKYATLDVKGGSNSTVLKMTDMLYRGTRMYMDILESRSSFMLVDVPVDHTHRKMYVETSMLSAMGNGYTFEILALTLLALCRAIDPEASVYGDDIIVTRDSATEVAETIALFGYELNMKKSYLHGTFRESCGAFYLDGRGYVTCYDIKWCHNINDVINVVNKIGRIIRLNEDWTGAVKKVLESTYDELIRNIPCYMKGPRIEQKDLPRWVEVWKNDWAKIHREDDYCRSLYKNTLKRFAPLLENWNYKPKDLAVIHVFSPREVILHKRYDHVTKPWTLSFYLMSIGNGGRPLDLLRQDPERRQYRRETLLLIQGQPIKMGDARKALRDTGS